MANRSTTSMIDRGAEAMQRTAETMGDTVVQILDKLAGTKTDLKLIFQDLSVDAGSIFKARMNGAIVLEATMVKESGTTTVA